MFLRQKNIDVSRIDALKLTVKRLEEQYWAIKRDLIKLEQSKYLYRGESVTLAQAMVAIAEYLEVDINLEIHKEIVKAVKKRENLKNDVSK
jgi:hypothetical protein